MPDDVPRYPAERSGNAPAPDRESEQPPAARRATHLWWIVGTAAVMLFLVLHLTGVLGPGSH